MHGISRLPFELALALRYLRPKRTYVSIITLISIIGVMLGVAVLIIVISVMSGFDRQLRDRLLGFNAHLQIYAEQPFAEYHPLMRLAESDPEVRGVAPYVIGQTLLQTEPEEGEAKVSGAVLRGINPHLEAKVSNLPKSVIRGKFDVSGNGLIVGVDLARSLDLQVGDRLLVYSTPTLAEMQRAVRRGHGELPLPDEYEVRGIFDVGYYEINAQFVVSSLSTAQDLLGLGNKVQGLMVMLKDPYQAQQARARLGSKLPPGFLISTWQESNSTLLQALAVEKNVMFYLLFFIMIVAAFGIVSVLITFVVQKTREIGMLKALGATSGQVMLLFLSQGVTVGVFGVAAGCGAGWLGMAYRNEFLQFMRRATGWELFPATIYQFNELPAYLTWRDLAIICGGSFLICVVAGLIPAWHAGGLKPVEALRHE